MLGDAAASPIFPAPTAMYQKVQIAITAGRNFLNN